MATEKPSKKGWILFGIEAGVLLVVAIVLLVLLNYFNILSLHRYIPFLDFLPRQGNNIFEKGEEGDSPITVNSQRKDYRVTLNHPETLSAFFRLTNTLENASIQLKQPQPFSKAIITLTDEKRLQNQYAYFDGSTTTEFAYQLNAVNDTLVIFIYLPEKILESPEASQLFGRAVIYSIAHYEGIGDRIDPLPSTENIDGLFTLESLRGGTETTLPIPARDGGEMAVPVPSRGVER